MGKELIELGVTEAAIAELATKYNKAWDCSIKAQYEVVRKGIAELRGLRTRVEKRRKELKAPLLEQSKLIDGEAKRIIGELTNIETPMRDAKAEEDERIERAKQEEARKEAERQAKITQKINWILAQAGVVTGRSSEEIKVVLEGLKVVDTTDCAERKETADAVLAETLEKVEAAYQQALELEAFKRQQAEMAAEKERLAKKEESLQAREEAARPQKASINPFGATSPSPFHKTSPTPFGGAPNTGDHHPTDAAIKEAVEAIAQLGSARDIVIAIIDQKIPHIIWDGPR